MKPFVVALAIACDAAPPAPGTSILTVGAQEKVKDDFEAIGSASK